MELKSLQTFQTIVREDGFARAAEKLNYTQSAITFQMQQLERELGVPLFEKVGRRMRLTQAGERLIPYVDETLESLERLRDFESELSECRGELRLGVGETLLCYRLPSILSRFQREAPHARIFVRSMSCCDIRDELLTGSLDVGVFYQEVGGFGNHLTIRSMGEHSLVLVAAPEVKERCPDFITPGQRLPVPLLAEEPQSIFRQIFEEYLRQQNILLDHTIELWSIPTIKKLVAGGLGVAFLPRFAAEEELSSGALVEIPTAMGVPGVTAVCGVYKNKWVSPLMERFLELCCA